jgi:4'-phosphopantetheinyl transferase EntD
MPCAELAALLPAGTAAAHLQQAVLPGMLLPAERRHISRWSPKRQQDFTAGRVCARRALQQFGLGEFALQAGTDGLPSWPAGMTGCITHTTGYAAAVVGLLTRVRGLGIDSEVVDAVNEEVWKLICTPAEYTALLDEVPERCARYAALIFSAKEAFYKCQYPLTREWLEFSDLAVAIRGNLSLTGEFEIRPQRLLRVQRQGREPLVGRYRIHASTITAVMALPAYGE